jgi:triosephosphate isomerase (TIM)
MRTPLVVGNWKCNGSREWARRAMAAWAQMAPALRGVEVAICPPYPYLADAAAGCGAALALGAQDVAAGGDGAHTGEVSARMLVDLGCRYVIVGHSERRTEQGESDALAAAKFEAALRGGLTPILCVGEQLAEREAGKTGAVVLRQLGAVLERVGADELARGVLAYEPVWAIGTGRTASAAQAQAVHALLRGELGAHGGAVRILYGGSVKPDNAADLFSQADVDGGLIGGASLDIEQFTAICRAAERT